ncbi:MAG: 4-hydroxy-3-methylbut-2-enyl diphosphate reductase [Rickettsiales bacterium]|nr:4-hydroxy-3-methylbut-2-enyl diphosphate reductase [Pseudomonadota bacterium]MDA0965859.1 4-hydroxy-3-methylbut-2-enyl diphosphate reductase [Pseudomonadota bacterium]MDG4542671.1 4-hydroxy-3-methylbut-2-enyl diphosphate reductase [Rickettsiales bacterium]MDG4545175.1 4-hydroxy-3-methylbut-2-enyl diphosphate reductase [Rickettsiales bacterium]MDG4547298.1 4-hydroxy-3-methylbut-2-enyl diphosphate reductase [Rickettsiales bacterium]
MKIILAQPRGFCAGVKRAIEIVEKALEKYGTPIYVRHEIVHNKYVVDDLRAKGVVFVNEIDEVPDGAVTIFSAHGVSQKVIDSAKNRQLPVIDATCPLVTKVHKEAQRSEEGGNQIILIGHQGHPEVEGTSGQVKSDVILVENVQDVKKIEVADKNRLSYVTQTTLSVDDTKDIIAALKERFPNISGPGIKDICYATQNRQDAVRSLAKITDIILVIGSQNSSNSNRLKDLAQEMGVTSYLINDVNDINVKWFENVERIGITAGASAPEILIDKIIGFFRKKYDVTVTTMDGTPENVIFKLPKEVA